MSLSWITSSLLGRRTIVSMLDFISMVHTLEQKDIKKEANAFHHYIKGHISVFSRGFICFCCLEPNFLHGVSCPYCPEYWRVSSVIPQKNWGVWTHFLIFDPFYWLEKQPACDKSCIETAFECSFSFWNPFNLSAYGLFLHDMSEEHIVPKLA